MISTRTLARKYTHMLSLELYAGMREELMSTIFIREVLHGYRHYKVLFVIFLFLFSITLENHGWAVKKK